MKDLLKAFIPVTIGILLFTYLAEKGNISRGTWPGVVVMIITFTIAVYFVIRLFRRKKFPKP